MIFGRPQVGLDAAVSAGGRGRTPALSARARVSAAEKFGDIFIYSRHFQLPDQRAGFVKRDSNIQRSDFLLDVPLARRAPPVPSGRDSPASL